MDPWLMQLQHPYYYTKNDVLELRLAPYMVPSQKLRKLYMRFGDLRFLCLLPKDKPERAKIREPLDFIGHLLVFDLMLSLNPIAVVEAVWPVSSANQARWQHYSRSMLACCYYHRLILTTDQDIWLPQGQFELTHHMLKKFLVDCQHPWTFVVRMDMNCIEQVGRFGALHDVEPASIFGDVNLDKFIVSLISVRDLMTIARCSKSHRLRVWLFLLHHPPSQYQRLDDVLHMQYPGCGTPARSSFH